MARGRSGRSSRPRYQWMRESGIPVEMPDGSGGVGIITLSDAEILAEALAAPTLVRVRGTVLAALDPATSSAGINQRIGIGIIVVPSGVTAVEVGGPIANPNINWMYWRVDTLIAPAPGGADENVEAGFGRYVFDVKAMRKIHKSHVHLIAENPGETVAHVLTSVAASFLFQE